MTINLNNESDSEMTGNDQPVIVKTQNVKQHETDSEMLIRISKKFAILFVIILMFDSILDLLAGLVDLMIELFHLVIEIFEYTLELLLEYIFNAHHHESEVIIANVTILLVIYLLLRFIFKLPDLLIHLQNKINTAWLKRKHQEECNWKALPLERRIKIGAAYSVGVFGVLFLLTL